MIEVVFNFSDKDIRRNFYSTFHGLKIDCKLLDLISKRAEEDQVSIGIPLTKMIIKIIDHKEKRI